MVVLRDAAVKVRFRLRHGAQRCISFPFLDLGVEAAFRNLGDGYVELVDQRRLAVLPALNELAGARLRARTPATASAALSSLMMVTLPIVKIILGMLKIMESSPIVVTMLNLKLILRKGY